MKEMILYAVTVFMGFFAIMNPIANTPVFLGLTAGYDKSTVRAVALRSVGLAFLIVTLFAISGKLIFDLFGITVYALRITGGILVVQIGFHMLRAKPLRFSHQQKISTSRLSKKPPWVLPYRL